MTPDTLLLTRTQATDAWNALPYETRESLVAYWHYAHINHLEAYKLQLQRSIRQIDQQIDRIRREIHERE